MYISEKINYDAHPESTSMHQVIMTERALHFWRMKINFDSIIHRIECFYASPLCGKLPGNTNVISTLSIISFWDVVLKATVTRRERTSCCARNKILLYIHMQHIGKEHSKPGALILNPCRGTVAIAKACLLEGKYHQFIGYDKESGCFNKMWPSLKHVLSLFSSSSKLWH